MIPKLTFDREAAERNWAECSPQEINDIAKLAAPLTLTEGCGFEVHMCDDNYVDMGIYKEFKHVRESLVMYGYCSTHEALAKYLDTYNADKEKNYYVEVGLLDMDYEKYYKFGSYINNEGVDTGDDYDWDCGDEQQYEDKWIRFAISEITE